MVIGDDRFELINSKIFKSLDVAFKQVEDYITVFEPYRQTYAENRRYTASIAVNLKDVPLEVYRSEIDKYLGMARNFERIPVSAVVGIMQVESGNMRACLMPSPSECLLAIKELLPVLMERTASDLLDNLGAVIPVIGGGVTTVEGFVRKKKAVTAAHADMEDHKCAQKRLQDMAALMLDYKWPLPDSEKAHLVMIEEHMNALESGVQVAESVEEEETKRFAEHMKDEVPRLKKLVASVREDLDNAIISSTDSSADKVLGFLGQQAAVLASHKTRAAKLADYQAILGQPVDEYDVLDEAQADLTLKTKLWEGVKEWGQLTAVWLTTPFKKVDAAVLEKYVTMYLRTCSQAAKGLPGNPVAKQLKADVETFAPALPVVVNLRNDFLKERHWQRIHELVGFDILGQDELTLGDLLEKKVTDFHEDIANVATTAVQESVLEEMMAKVATRWEACELEVRPYKDVKDLFILGDVTEVVANLDDSLVTVNTVLSSRYVAGIRALVDTWRGKLVRVQEVIEEWLICQRNWIYLESIFSSPDIVRQLPAAAKVFAYVDKSWRHIMRLAADDPLVMKQGMVQGRKELFESHNAALDKVQKSLEEYLETKRAAFPRFYFLSNDELLEILSQSKDPQAVQPHLRKCFDNLVLLDFGDKAGSVDIGAMVSSEGERVPLGRNLKARGYVEDWLTQVELRMRSSLHGFMKAGLLDYDTKPRSEWVTSHPGQIVATVAQMTWARETEKVLRSTSPLPAMRAWLKTYIAELTRLIVKIRGDLTRLERKIIVALVTTDVHARDIIEDLCDSQADSVQHFTWVQQLRYYWDMEVDNCIIRHSDAKIPYGYEYMGATSRLVITPLTDRCWLTLTGSFELKLGAAPAGPAGTGKTESSKDLAKAMGMLCVVFNCSDQIDYLMMAKLFRGLAQGGYWICLDEFNRIDIEVLSVIAQQLLVLREGRLMGKPNINFMGVQIGLKDHHVIVTMNPGYAGRTELPDNLQVCFRPVSMMVPNYALIAEIMLFAEGFADAKTLSRKMCKLYILCSEQLSQQPHYDYGLRAVKSVLVMAGTLKRAMPDVDEDLTLIRALVDSNVPKFLAEDLPLFAAIVQDLFPGKSVPVNDYGELSGAMDLQLARHGLQVVPRFSAKIIQLHETFQIRFGAVLVGPAGAGKTTCYRILAAVMTYLREQNSSNPIFQVVRTEVLNPKCITMGELYGEFSQLTQEWHDGLASTIMRRAVGDTTTDKKWTVFDGPIDALWIENMNTVLDDNMTLCLANGERIKLKSDMKMLFEVMDLAVASPATVSRIGVVYMTPTDLGWMPYVRSWTATLQVLNCPHNQPMVQRVLWLFVTFFQRGLDFQRKHCREPVECVDVQLATSLALILQSLLLSTDSTNSRIAALTETELLQLVDKLFAFAFTWSIGGSIDETQWEAMDQFTRDLFQEAGLPVGLPPSGTIYDFYVDLTAREFSPWASVVPAFEYNPALSYFQLVVPTVDTARYSYLFSRLIAQSKPIFITGATGTGKTVMVQSLLGSLAAEPEDGGQGLVHTTINFSAQTQSLVTQLTIEGKLEKKRKNLLGPAAGRKMLVVFVDDVNMPVVEEYGAQPPVELLRQFLDFKGFYDRDKLFWKDIADTLLLTAAAPPGGGRSRVTPRFTRHYNVFCVPQASASAMSLIFGSMLTGFLSRRFDPEIKKKATAVVDATIEVYTRISAELLPTPARFHYTFNLRDVSKVFQGILMVTSNKCQTPATFARLWLHECQRVFYDRLICTEDQQWFHKLAVELLTRHLRLSWSADEVFLEDSPIVFCDFLRPGAEVSLYEECTDMAKLRQLLDDSLDEYNMVFANQMKLVFFADAVVHVVRISRILRQPRGNAMLVGVGGSGKQSLTRMASFVAGYECVQIEINRGYGSNEFRNDIKAMMMKAGILGKGITFLFTDTQIIVNTMMEDINNLLNSGEIPNLFQPEELDKVANDMLPVLRQLGIPETRDNCFMHFVLRVRDNLHIVLCMSPVGAALRVHCRNFPSLINCTTVDWFFPWPESALISVAQRFFETLPLPSDEVRAGLVGLCGEVHTSVASAAARFFAELRRQVYTTPKSYLDLISSYTAQLGTLQARIEEKAQQMVVGIAKLRETNSVVTGLQEELTKLEPVLEEKGAAAAVLLAQVEVDKAEAALVRERVSKEEAQVGKQAAEVAAVQADAQADLDVALPALEKALKALDSLTKADITEVKSFAKPPEAVQTVMEAVCVLFEMKPDWDSAKKLLGDSQFMDKLKGYDKDNIKETVLKKIKAYTANPSMQVDVVSKVSKAATGLCMFVHAMDVYSRVAKVVAPKKARVEEMSKILADANAVLESKRAELETVDARVAHLEQQCQETMEEKQRLADETDTTARRLERAEKLTSGLASEGIRWAASLEELSRQKVDVIGDAFLGCACVSYYGPFTGTYRDELISHWVQSVLSAGVPCSPKFSLVATLGSAVEVQEWQNMSLPTDKVSTDSAILVTKGTRWPLMIDPQSQAHRWIKNLHRKDGIEVTTMTNINLLRTLESCIRVGKPLLLEDIGEQLEPALEPILQRATFRQGTRLLIRIGDNSVDYDPNFKLYLTTKLANPHYLPETCIKVNVINFTVTMEGLEDQILGQVVAKERPDVEKRKTQLLLHMAEDRKQLQELEAKILDLLSKSTGNILDDEVLINTLADSKTTSSIIKERVEESEKTEVDINNARNGYRSAATRGSLVYFVISDLGTIDPMYQYSLQYYQALIDRCIDSSETSEDLATRLDKLITYTTSLVFDNICRGLFEKDKLLFSSLMCFQILRHAGRIPVQEWNLFLRGAPPRHHEHRRPIPDEKRLTQPQWDLLCALDEVLSAPPQAHAAAAGGSAAAHGDAKGGQDATAAATAHKSVSICDSIAASWDAWCKWADASNGTGGGTPATRRLPDDLDDVLTDFQKLLVVKAFREDQLLAAIANFVGRNLGERFASSPSATMEDIYLDLDNKTPCIFILSKGADPTAMLLRFAAKMGYQDRMGMVSLGQGQGPYAAELIAQGTKTGNWVLLQNCMLAKSWMPALEQIVLALGENAGTNSPDFRLYLTSAPAPYFPVSILQNGVKMTNEPPKGVRANVSRSWGNLVKPEDWSSCPKPTQYKKLMVGLLFFHANVQERRKFGPLGWNILYAFDESDLQTSISVLSRFLREGDHVPWDALRFVTGHINYGGRVTDDWDRRCLMSILSIYLNENILRSDFKFSRSGVYYAPPAGSFEAVANYFNTLPAVDDPEIFGMHQNANVTFNMKESTSLMDIVISLQPRDSGSAGGTSNDDIIIALAEDIEQQLPAILDADEAGPTTFVLQPNGLLCSLAIVLKQEMAKFNVLLTTMQATISELKKAIRGLVVMSLDLDKMYTSLLVNRVPMNWGRVSFASLKSLAAWVKDLVERVAFMRIWLQQGQPACFPLPVFFFPQGFMTGTLQTFSRKYQVAIDTLNFEYDILNEDPAQVESGPEDGVLCYGLWLEGARWHAETGRLQPSRQGEMYTQLPLIHFKPAAGHKPAPTDYQCPVYKTAERKGVLSTTGMSTNFVVAISLPTDLSPDTWVLYGVAALLNLTE